MVKFFTSSLVVMAVSFLLSSCAMIDPSFNRTPVLDQEDANKISLTIESDNLPALKAILSKLPADKNQRSFADNVLIDKATIKTAAQGEKCNKDIVDFLLTENGNVYFNSGNYVEKESYLRAFCGNYILNYMIKTGDKYAAENAQNTYNNFISFMNREFDTKNTELLIARLQKYKEIILLVHSKAYSFCATQPTSEACIASGIYKKLPNDLAEKIKTDNASKNFKEFWANYLKELKNKL